MENSHIRKGVNPPKESCLVQKSRNPIRMTTSHDGRCMIAKNQCGTKAASSPFRAGIRKKEYLKP